MAASGDAGGDVSEFGEVLVRRGSVVVVNATPDRFDELERVQAASYPTLAQSDLILATHLRAQHAAFAEGQHMAIDTETGRVVGMNCGLLTDSFDEAHPQHTFQGMTGGLMFTTHTPSGAWYYGADICVHPDCRGKGVGRMLYDARKAVARRHNCKGITSGGLIPGYCRHMAGHPKCGPEPLTAREYVSKVVAGELNDPTLSFQLRCGFEVVGVIDSYLEDTASGNYAAAIVWRNPDYSEAGAARER